MAMTILVALLTPLYWLTAHPCSSLLEEILEPLCPFYAQTLEVISNLLSDPPALAVLFSPPANFLEGIVDEGQFAVVAVSGSKEIMSEKAPTTKSKVTASSVELNPLSPADYGYFLGPS